MKYIFLCVLINCLAFYLWLAELWQGRFCWSRNLKLKTLCYPWFVRDLSSYFEFLQISIFFPFRDHPKPPRLTSCKHGLAYSNFESILRQSILSNLTKTGANHLRRAWFVDPLSTNHRYGPLSPQSQSILVRKPSSAQILRRVPHLMSWFKQTRLCESCCPLFAAWSNEVCYRLVCRVSLFHRNNKFLRE